MGTDLHVPNRVLCKAADLNRRPVQEKGVCSDFNLTGTSTTDGGAQKRENDLWHGSELIATKVCSQISRK